MLRLTSYQGFSAWHGVKCQPRAVKSNELDPGPLKSCALCPLGIVLLLATGEIPNIGINPKW